MEEYNVMQGYRKMLDYDNWFNVRLDKWVFKRSKRSIWKKRRRR